MGNNSDRKATMRDDIHRPSLLDPAEYDFVAAFYQGDSEWIARGYEDEHEVYDGAIQDHPTFAGNFMRKNTCDHCGAAFAHGVLFLHTPSGKLVHVGHICAGNTVGLPDRAAKVRKQAERQAEIEKEKAERQAAGEEWRNANADLIEWLNSLPEDGRHSFLTDMIRSIENYGRLTDRQAESTRKWQVGAAKRAEREKAEKELLENAPTLESGRRSLSGTVVSTKWHESMYGSVLKMLVRLDDGNKVWGTVPASIDTASIVGSKVNFTATVQAKEDHFGFFSRPSNAKVIESS